MSKNKKKKIAPRPRPRPPADERPPAIPEADTELTRSSGPKLKKVSKRGGGDFNIEMKIPKELVNRGVMYGYKKGGQI